ncbi:hypothetical protein [Halococcus sp. IIIV-5B]|uniref:hypothetical protein n=1 Tax=Halococcus sp. IIIV-5B TaxID=2321230 RepID=UPI0011C350D5|nr:hypothetical protein [Halococcus sp. IIIV-5B]
MARTNVAAREWESPVGVAVFLASAFISQQLAYGTFGMALAFGLIIAGGWHLRDGQWRIFAGWLLLSGVSQLIIWLIFTAQGAPL